MTPLASPERKIGSRKRLTASESLSKERDTFPMTTSQCTPGADTGPIPLCSIRLVEFAYAGADDGISAQASARTTLRDRDEIDMLLTLADESCKCDFCDEPATHVEDGVLLCTPPTTTASTEYLIRHSKASSLAKLQQTGRDSTVTSSIIS